MNIELAAECARLLLLLYEELKVIHEDLKHDPEAHNLCLAVVEESGKNQQEFLSYSSPAALSVAGKKFLGTALANAMVVGAPSGVTPFINRGGMQDLHTEVRLINFLAAAGLLRQVGSTNNVITFFSTRTVCPGCQKAIITAQNAYPGTGFVFVSLHAEERDHTLEQMYPGRPMFGMDLTKKMSSEVAKSSEEGLRYF